MTGRRKRVSRTGDSPMRRSTTRVEGATTEGLLLDPSGSTEDERRQADGPGQKERAGLFGVSTGIRPTSPSLHSPPSRSATVDRWEELTRPEAPSSNQELVAEGHSRLETDYPGFSTEPAVWEEGARCEVCGKGVREGLRVCSGLSECFMKLEKP